MNISLDNDTVDSLNDSLYIENITESDLDDGCHVVEESIEESKVESKVDNKAENSILISSATATYLATPPPALTPAYVPTVLDAWLAKYKKYPLFDRIAGLIYGCALGDALGVQVEGVDKEYIKYNVVGGKVSSFLQGRFIGTNTTADWTDDTDQLILLMETLMENNLSYDYLTFARKIHSWVKKGFPELGDLAGMGVGSLTARVISKENYLTQPITASHDTYKELGGVSAPNGAVMRCGIAAICKKWQRVAVQQCLVTHVDSRCLYSSWLVVAMCRRFLQGKNIQLDELLQNKDVFIKREDHVAEFNKYSKVYNGDLNNMLEKLELDDMGAAGYTLKTLGCAIYVLRKIVKGDVKSAADYKTVQLEIVNQGGDADTNAAVSGQVLGSYLGYSNLPKDWLAYLKNKYWLDKKIVQLFKTIVS